MLESSNHRIDDPDSKSSHSPRLLKDDYQLDSKAQKVLDLLNPNDQRFKLGTC